MARTPQGRHAPEESAAFAQALWAAPAKARQPELPAVLEELDSVLDVAPRRVARRQVHLPAERRLATRLDADSLVAPGAHRSHSQSAAAPS